MANDARVLRLVQQHAAARQSIADRVALAMRRLFRPASQDSWYSPEWIKDTATRAASISRQAQVAHSSSTAKYLDLVLAEYDGFPASALGTDVRSSGQSAIDLPEDLRHVDPVEIYSRPAATFRRAIVEDVEPEVAAERAVRRAELLSDMDLQLAGREALQQTLTAVEQRLGVTTGYRRIIHPELSEGGVCGLCLAAADRVYQVEDLMAVHERCKCTSLPIVDGEDPGLVLNRTDIAAVYKAAGSTGQQDLAKIRFKVVEHGELGPVLRLQGQNTRTAEDAVADASDRIDVTPWSEVASADTRQRSRQDSAA